MSTIDVIVPCYNYGHYLEQCVDSVLSQRGPRVRVLILDDASPDDTFEVATKLARKDARVTVRRHVTNLRHIATYNEGIAWCAADYLLLLSADDYLLPNALARACDVLDANPGMGFCFGNAARLDESGLSFAPNVAGRCRAEGDVEVVDGERFINLSGATNFVSTPTAVVRTAVQKRLGGYRPELPHSGDMEMWFRIAAHGSVGILGAFQAVYRQHAANMSRAYFATSRIPDLQERKAAIDWFALRDGQVLRDPQATHADMLHALARDAVGYASSAFNEGRFEAAEALSHWAAATSPSIRRSLAWSKFACKRRIGLERWQAVEPAVAQLRRVAGRSGIRQA